MNNTIAEYVSLDTIVCSNWW